MGKSCGISYVDSSCNPVMGCYGCELYNSDPNKNHCYAAALINRYAGRKGWPKRFNEPELFPGRLEKALSWSDLTGTTRPDKPWLDGQPRIIFINDLADGFCPDVDPVEWLAPHLEAMAESPHIWLLLTKWPHRMRSFCADYPLPENVWPGVSVLRQEHEWRIVELLKIWATQYWLSCEPLLERLDISPYMPHPDRKSLDWDKIPERGDGFAYPFIGISWTAIGCESGPHRRPCNHYWVRDLIDQCDGAGVSAFVKQVNIDGRVSHDMAEWPADLRVREFPT